MKADRKLIYDKFNGHCAYCGSELNGKFQIDHIISQRNFEWHIKNNRKVPEFLKHLNVGDCNHVDNLAPACASCNNYKSTHDLEMFRDELESQPERLIKYIPTFRLAERFGLVAINNKKVVFYFETLP